MDIVLENRGRIRLRRRVAVGAGIAVAVVALTITLAKLKAAVPSLDRSSVFIDTVTRGPLDFTVRAGGTLVPTKVRWIPAAVSARVDRILVRPGAAVLPNTLIIELSNPEVELAARDAEWQLRKAEADYSALKARLDGKTLDKKVEAAHARAEALASELQLSADEELAKQGLISDINLRIAKAKAEEQRTRQTLVEKQLDLLARSSREQLQAESTRVATGRELAAAKRAQADSLRVQAGIRGVLQQVAVEVGQRVEAGATLAKVVRPDSLEAELRVAENQAGHIALGQAATIDVGGAKTPGRVVRVAPSVEEGAVTVAVRIDGPLPAGTRPQQSISGIIEIAHLTDVLYVGRPAFAREGASVALFKLDRSGNRAHRTSVRLGRISADKVEILSGLHVADEVILSDMTAYDAASEVKLR